MTVVYTTNLGLGKQTAEQNWGAVERQSFQRIEDRLAGTASTGPATASHIGAYKGQKFYDYAALLEYISAAAATTASQSGWHTGWGFATDGSVMLQNNQVLKGKTTASANQSMLYMSTGDRTVVGFASSAQLDFMFGTSIAASVKTAGFDLVGTNGEGTRTISTSTPSGGSDGDVWYEV